jgi:hypothetical protein
LVGGLVGGLGALSGQQIRTLFTQQKPGPVMRRY